MRAIIQSGYVQLCRLALMHRESLFKLLMGCAMKEKYTRLLTFFFQRPNTRRSNVRLRVYTTLFISIIVFKVAKKKQKFEVHNDFFTLTSHIFLC